jgi:hypothetical protein
MRFKLLLLFIIFIKTLPVKAQGQFSGTGSWNIITVNLPGSTQHRWGGYFEAQNRNYGVTNNFYYYELKTGVSYNFDNNSFALLGTGRYSTYGFNAVDDGPQITETRFWEQFTTNHYISRLKLEHRYRIEQRWLNTGYRNRFRYRLTATLPLNKPKLEQGTLFAAVFAEVFFNNKQPNFERNRFSPSLGYRFTKPFTFQAGFINQRNYAINNSDDKNYLILTATYNLQRK